MNKDQVLDELQTQLKRLKRSDGFSTDAGLDVEYGITEPAFDGVDRVQWLDEDDEYVSRQERLVKVTVSIVLYDKRPNLYQRGKQLEADFKKLLCACPLKVARVSTSKEVEESGSNSVINVAFSLEIPTRS